MKAGGQPPAFFFARAQTSRDIGRHSNIITARFWNLCVILSGTGGDRCGQPLAHVCGLFAVLAVVLCTAAPAWAQSTATLQGTVTDSQSGIMPGVSVTIRNTATGAERPLVTDDAGEYVAAALQPGHYEVVAHVDGFRIRSASSISGPAQTVAVNLKLGLGTLAENVTVTGAVAAHRHRHRVGRPGHGRADRAGDSAERPAFRRPRSADARRQ